MIFIKTLLEFFRDKEYRDLLFTTIIAIIIGMIAYHFLEDWTWIDSLYFSVITLTTVGYGDLVPQTDAGKVFTILYIIMGIGIILAFVNTIYNHFTAKRDRKKHKKKKRTKEVHPTE
jgi:hypothetical protein